MGTLQSAQLDGHFRADRAIKVQCRRARASAKRDSFPTRARAFMRAPAQTRERDGPIAAYRLMLMDRLWLYGSTRRAFSPLRFLHMYFPSLSLSLPLSFFSLSRGRASRFFPLFFACFSDFRHFFSVRVAKKKNKIVWRSERWYLLWLFIWLPSISRFDREIYINLLFALQIPDNNRLILFTYENNRKR